MPKTEITYTKIGDYLIPDLILPPDDDNRPIGIWGCGCPVDTSAVGRSTDRAGRRDEDITNILKFIERLFIPLCL